MNNWSGLGRLTKDPEIRYTQSGIAMANFTLAIDRRSKEKATDFIQCKAIGKIAEVIEKYVSKGDLIGVSGEIQTGSYEKDGKKVYTWCVFVSSIDFTGKRETTSGKDEKQEAKSEIPEGFSQLTDDDIPF